MTRYYIGLATTKHDPAIAVVDPDGDVIFAEASERYLQDKRAPGAPADPRQSVARIIDEHCDPSAEFVVAKSWSRFAHKKLYLMRLLDLTNHERLPHRSSKVNRYLGSWRDSFGAVWMQNVGTSASGGHVADVLARRGNTSVSFTNFPHHYTHAATGCFTSPFDEAACMVVDGQGESGSISYFAYANQQLRLVEEMKGAESLGLLYSHMTTLCGFSPDKGEEWKVMGLAPYGEVNEEILADLRSLVTVDGLTFKYPSTREIRAWVARMERWARPEEAPIVEAADLACTAQHFYAEVMDQLLSAFYALGISKNLVLTGGCALNSSYNGTIVRRLGFEALHVPSAPADDGNAVGAALLAYQRDNPTVRLNGSARCPYLGSTLSKASLDRMADIAHVPGMRRVPGRVAEEAADILAEGKLVGWVQGRAEFGPRALGNRSILADPRTPDIKDTINARVKFREEFRPLAPSVLDEFGDEYFENYQVSRYMERTLRFKEAVRDRVPGVVHVNGTGRLQSVRREWNERYYDLIRAFHERTGVPMILNTSFNVLGKPIIHSLEDALGVFYTTGLDALVIDDYIIEK